MYTFHFMLTGSTEVINRKQVLAFYNDNTDFVLQFSVLYTE
jgi:hypothetical protein